MKTRRQLAAVVALCVLSIFARPTVVAAAPTDTQEITAIDILLHPDATMLEHAHADNARLRKDYPQGFALDAQHTPHISILQCYAHTKDLDKVYAAVNEATAKAKPVGMKLKTTGYYYLPDKSLGLAGITIATTPELLAYQQAIITAVTPFTAKTGTAAAFLPNADGTPTNQFTVSYVDKFIPEHSGPKFLPHVTIGLGHEAFVKQLKAAPYKPFEFQIAGVAIYHLGNYGTAQVQLSPPVKELALAADPLPSWNEGPAKTSLKAFVGEVTTVGGKNFVPVDERIATFDNDGTLWCEQPVYVQIQYAFDRIVALAPKHPEWKTQQPFKAVLEHDVEALAASGVKGISEIVMVTHAGDTTQEFTDSVTKWLATARHPRFKRPYTELSYQPMLELLAYLRASQFKTFIVSGGGIEFMRPWTRAVYGVPPEQVVGSSIKTKFEFRDGKPVLARLAEVNFIDDGPGKPVGINQYIGRRPICAFGNSDGDLEMLQWTTAGGGLRYGLIVHHTDAVREYAYDRKSHIGRLDKALDLAPKNGWTVVSMKDDWKVIFPPEKK